MRVIIGHGSSTKTGLFAHYISKKIDIKSNYRVCQGDLSLVTGRIILLAPDASMTVIVKKARSSIAFLTDKLREFKPDPVKMIVSGWSAGAQLAALCLDMPDVIGGLVVSRLFDLEPIRLCYLNKKLNLTTEEYILN